jgi:hypothetical protein
MGLENAPAVMRWSREASTMQKTVWHWVRVLSKGHKVEKILIVSKSPRCRFFKNITLAATKKNKALYHSKSLHAKSQATLCLMIQSVMNCARAQSLMHNPTLFMMSLTWCEQV